MVALMIIGVYSSFLIPREEEPQIMFQWPMFWLAIQVRAQQRLKIVL